MIDISQFLGGPDYPPDTVTNVINMSAEIGAHELGHLSGLIHGDAFGPVGAGIYANLADNPYLDGYTPPTPVRQTPSTQQYDVIASPASVGTSLFDAASTTFFGERDDISLAFADSGTTTNETPGDPNTSIATAQPVTLVPLNVPEHALDWPGHRRHLRRHRRRCRRLDPARRRWPEQCRLLRHHRDRGRAAQFPDAVAVLDPRQRTTRSIRS